MISVIDPVKQDQGALNPYITYKINTQTDRSVPGLCKECSAPCTRRYMPLHSSTSLFLRVLLSGPTSNTHNFL